MTLLRVLSIVAAAALAGAANPPCACTAVTATAATPTAAAVAASTARDSTVVAAATAPAAPADLATARIALMRAVYGSTDSILAARAQLEALAAASPKSAALHYWVALADYRLVPRLMKDAKAAARYCKDGLDQLDRAIAIQPKFADAIALEGGLQGLEISLDPTRAMALGPQIVETLGRAAALEPANPRVALLDGINTYHVPRFVGGGPDKALVRLAHAQQLYAAEKAGGPDAIRWGADDAFLWAGRACVELALYDQARAFYDKALAANPSNGWVKYTLLPELDHAAKAKP